MPNPRSARHRARRPAARHVRWAAPLLAALAAAGFYVAHGTGRQAGNAIGRAGATLCGAGQDAISSGASPCPAPVPSGPAVQDGSGSVQRTGSGSPVAQGPAVRRGTPAPSASHPASTTPSPGPSSAAPSPAPGGGAGQPDAAAQVLALINHARVQAGLPAYVLSTALDKAAVNHDLRMANGCGLYHQCKDEPGLGRRETQAGVHWTQAGENIGEAAPAPTSAIVTQKALALTRGMLAERPPNDGHRESILSRDYRYIGVAVTVDSTGTVWMTQDFAN